MEESVIVAPPTGQVAAKHFFIWLFIGYVYYCYFKKKKVKLLLNIYHQP